MSSLPARTLHTSGTKMRDRLHNLNSLVARNYRFARIVILHCLASAIIAPRAQSSHRARCGVKIKNKTKIPSLHIFATSIVTGVFAKQPRVSWIFHSEVRARVRVSEGRGSADFRAVYPVLLPYTMDIHTCSAS